MIGAGLTGITAASLLARKKRVLVIDKGRRIGGRLADHEIGEARFDKGGQFFTARDDRFAQQVRIWSKKGVVKEWYRKIDGQTYEIPRWRGVPNMRMRTTSMSSGHTCFVGKRKVSELPMELPSFWFSGM